MNKTKLIGPFKQIIPMSGLGLKGAISDKELSIYEDAGILVKDGKIEAIGNFEKLLKSNIESEIHELRGNHTCLPGLIDSHTHICFGGTRAKDYAMRNSGKTYLEIAKAGGGIWDTVTETRKATREELIKRTAKLANRHLKNGVTTIEVKSGYGLSVQEELKMLRAIKETNEKVDVDLISTCLAAHTLPKDFDGGHKEYLFEISEKLFPILKEEGLANRVDAFIEESAFSAEQIAAYFEKAKSLGFDITVHADRFHRTGL